MPESIHTNLYSALFSRLESNPFIGSFLLLFTKSSEDRESITNEIFVKTICENALISLPNKKAGMIPIGSGTTGHVFAAVQSNEFSSRAAAKIVLKYPHENQKIEEARKEIFFLRKIHHKNIIKLLHVEEDTSFIFIFTEFLEKGDLYNYISKNGNFDELAAFELFKQMMSALEFLHTNKICHHDFKLENCVLDRDLNVKLIDFGYGYDFSHLHEGELFHHYTGSPAYSAYEILFRKPHNCSVDIFSLGCCLYYMLAGTFPFCDEKNTTFEQLCLNVYAEIIDFPTHFSPEVKDLTKRMLAKHGRINWREIKSHPWHLACEAKL